LFLQPQSCTSENEKDNFFHFLCPAGLAILPNLLCYQWLEVCKYVSAVDASHIR